MPEYDADLLDAARRLLRRRAGQRGKLPTASVRRSISTSYYALFHFLLDEIGRRVVGTGNRLRIRRRMFARSITHKGARVALDKIKGPKLEASIANFLGVGDEGPPAFACNLARAF